MTGKIKNTLRTIEAGNLKKNRNTQPEVQSSINQSINKPAMLGSLGSKEILTKLNEMQLLIKFQNNLMDRSQVIRLNPS